MNQLRFVLFILSCCSIQSIFAQNNCGSAITIDACAHTPTEYMPSGDDAGFNLASCPFDGDDAVWISFTVTTIATEVTITLSDWGGCSGIFCTTDITGAFYSGSCGALTTIDDCIDMSTGFSNGTNLGPWTFPVTLNTTYYFRLSEEQDDGGFAELLFELNDCDAPLPLSLNSFDGLAEEAGNLIQWETASEEDTEWHIIQRSIGDKEDWKEVGRIPAAGYSTSIEEYAWMDENSVQEAYYRLLTVDYSGYESYSKAILIERSLVSNSFDRLFPNPANSTVNIAYTTTSSQEVAIGVYDMNGSLLLQEYQTSQRGLNQLTYDLSNLPAGIYIVRLTTPMDQFNKQLILNK